MQKSLVGSLVTVVSLAFGCAADDARERSSEEAASLETPADPAISAEAPVGVAFYGLTVIDCQDEATECFEKNDKGCTARLTDCLTDISLQLTQDTIQEVGETVQCGTDGLTCFSGVGEVQAAVKCQQRVEDCVIDRVKAVSGVKLPHSKRILGIVGDLVDTAVDIVEPVVGIATDVVGSTAQAAGQVVGATVDTAGHVVGETVKATGKVVVATLDATGEVVGTTVDATGKVVGGVLGGAVDAVGSVVVLGGNVLTGTLDAAGSVIGDVLKVPQCSLESSRCWRETRDYPACQAEYRACLKN